MAIIVGDGAIAQSLSYKLSFKANVYLATSSLFTADHRDDLVYDTPDFSSYWLEGIKQIKSIYQLHELIKKNSSTIIFCTGSLTLARSLSKLITAVGTYPIFFLTSYWKSLSCFLEDLGPFIIPVYPIIATEFWINKIVSVGEFDLEFPVECSSYYLNTSQYQMLNALTLKTIIMPMESRFKARFFLTSFLYWTFLEASEDSMFYESDSFTSLHVKYWNFISSFTSQFKDMSTYNLAMMLDLSKSLFLSSPKDSDLSWLCHILINHKRRKMLKFTERLKEMV